MKGEEFPPPAPPWQLILASASPRRRELIAHLGLPFTVVPSRYEEPPAPPTPVSLPTLVAAMAQNKAEEVAARTTGGIILAADTLVTADDAEVGIPLGKPTDENDARRMLRLLSGQTHRVYTGVVLIDRRGTAQPAPVQSQVVTTRVRFRELSDALITYYIQTGEPMDKAGAYGAQGFAAPFIEGFEGDFFNVVGLPLCRVGDMLEAWDIRWWEHNSESGSQISQIRSQ